MRPSYDLSCPIFSSFNFVVIFNITSHAAILKMTIKLKRSKQAFVLNRELAQIILKKSFYFSDKVKGILIESCLKMSATLLEVYSPEGDSRSDSNRREKAQYIS